MSNQMLKLFPVPFPPIDVDHWISFPGNGIGRLSFERKILVITTCYVAY